MYVFLLTGTWLLYILCCSQYHNLQVRNWNKSSKVQFLPLGGNNIPGVWGRDNRSMSKSVWIRAKPPHQACFLCTPTYWPPSRWSKPWQWLGRSSIFLLRVYGSLRIMLGSDGLLISSVDTVMSLTLLFVRQDWAGLAGLWVHSGWVAPRQKYVEKSTYTNSHRNSSHFSIPQIPSRGTA